MSFRSDRAQRRASKQRNIRILLIVIILIILLAVLAYFLFVQNGGENGVNCALQISTCCLHTPTGSPIFS